MAENSEKTKALQKIIQNFQSCWLSHNLDDSYSALVRDIDPFVMKLKSQHFVFESMISKRQRLIQIFLPKSEEIATSHRKKI